MKLCFALLTMSLGTAAVMAPAAAATTIGTSGYALFSNIRVADTLGVVIGPVAGTSGLASPAYTANNSLASLNTDVDLGVLALVRAGLGINTGILSSAITANGSAPGDTTTGSGRSQVNDLGINLFTRVSPLPAVTALGLSADTITSLTTVSRLGDSALLTGSSVFSNLNLSVLGLLSYSLGANAEVAPNTVLLNLLGIRIVLNEQIVGGNGTTMQSLTTNAINISLTDFLLGGQLLTGNVIIGNSFAQINIDPTVVTPGVPEPAVWLELIAGFGLAGAIARRRRTVAVTA